jgi:hypothetical protein
MDEQAVFLKFELFTKRLNKLIDMFTTIHQFSSLEQHTHITGACLCLLPPARSLPLHAGSWRS